LITLFQKIIPKSDNSSLLPVSDKYSTKEITNESFHNTSKMIEPKGKFSESQTLFKEIHNQHKTLQSFKESNSLSILIRVAQQAGLNLKKIILQKDNISLLAHINNKNISLLPKQTKNFSIATSKLLFKDKGIQQINNFFEKRKLQEKQNTPGKNESNIYKKSRSYQNNHSLYISKAIQNINIKNSKFKKYSLFKNNTSDSNWSSFDKRINFSHSFITSNNISVKVPDILPTISDIPIKDEWKTPFEHKDVISKEHTKKIDIASDQKTQIDSENLSNPLEMETWDLSFSEQKGIQEEALTKKIIDAKQTVRQFAQTLQEQIQNYKPPFSRMQISLEPKELGNVEVTLVNRGNNLHIQVNSNPTAIGVMATQGQELKNQLVSMGFTDVQMQFNMNQHQQQRQRQQRNAQQMVEIEEIPDFYESLDLFIPQYV
jgi:uncharacterized protein YozE (UPF0346 family)